MAPLAVAEGSFPTLLIEGKECGIEFGFAKVRAGAGKIQSSGRIPSCETARAALLRHFPSRSFSTSLAVVGERENEEESGGRGLFHEVGPPALTQVPDVDLSTGR